MTIVLLQDKSGNDQENLEPVLKKLEDLFHDGLKQFNAVYEGFSDFCQFIEIDLEVLISSSTPHGVGEVKKFVSWISAGIADPELRRATLERFREIWERNY